MTRPARSRRRMPVLSAAVMFVLRDQGDHVIGAAITDDVGSIAWTGLPGGDYRLAEHSATWCRIQASLSDAGDTFSVNPRMELMVNVWDCGADQNFRQEGDYR